MGEFFGSIYAFLFEDLIGEDLSNYLWGQASSNQETNMYTAIRLAMIGISLFVAVLFYYIVNHPRLCNFWGWLIFLIINFIINFVVGWQWVLKDLYAGLMTTVAPDTGQTIQLNIDEYNCLMFGLSNALLSIFVFFIISMIIKWWSKDVPAAPF